MPNRRAAAARLSQALSQGSVVAVVLFDIDHFKRINDTLGHSVGDQAIQRVGQTLLSCARDGDLVARRGGEELIGVLRGTSDGAHKLAERARIAVAALQTEAGPITISAGAAEGVAGTDPVKLADEKLLRSEAFRAKRSMQLTLLQLPAHNQLVLCFVTQADALKAASKRFASPACVSAE